MMNKTDKKDNVSFKPEHVRFKKKSQVTVPSKIVEALVLQEGDDLQCRLEDGKIVLVPTISIPKDQAWFWSEQWQKEEREVEEQIKDGKLSESNNLEEPFSDLDNIYR